MIVHPNNPDTGERFGLPHRFLVCTGAYKCEWLKVRSYATMVRGIHSEWIFLQRVMHDMGDAFAGVEKLLRETFLHRLFLRKQKYLTPIIGTLCTMLVK